MSNRRGRYVIGVSGYTITEVMIVLAATTVLFAAIAITFRGRQARAEFTSSVRAYEATVQNMLSDVVNGVYESNTCRAVATGAPSLGGANTSGSCVFLGKVITPYLDSTTQSEIVTVIGRRLQENSNTESATTLTQAKPTRDESMNERYNHNYQLEVVKVVRQNPPVYDQVYVYGFMVPLAGDLLSDPGKQASLYGADSSVIALVDTSDGISQPEYEIIMAGFVQLAGGITVCLRGQNGQTAEINIGSMNSPSSISTTLDTRPQPGDACHV